MTETLLALAVAGSISAILISFLCDVYPRGLRSQQGHVAWLILLAVAWPLVVLWVTLRHIKWLGRGFAEVYRVVVPEKISVPKAKIHKDMP